MHKSTVKNSGHLVTLTTSFQPEQKLSELFSYL